MRVMMNKNIMELKLTNEQVMKMVDTINSFYSKVPTIQDYFLERKKEKVINIDVEKWSQQLFNDHTLQPKDMDIVVEVVDQNVLNTLAQITISLPLESQIGRQIALGVKEGKTGKYLGFIKIASPVLSIKPRNDYFGETLRATHVNKHMVNGSVIVPTQPFGFNCLGGKLLALVCGSHLVLDLFKEKYGDKMDLCFLETTSLYGNIKTSSQYDGLEPYIKYNGMTESDLFLFPNDNIYMELRNFLRPIYGKEEWNGMLVDPKPSAPKMREYTKIIQIIKLHLKEMDIDKYNEFTAFVKCCMKSKTKKRYYYTTFGYSNIKEHILSDGSVDLVKKDNFDKYSLEKLVEYWKNKAQKRWEKLNSENRLKEGLEVYSIEKIEQMDYDMIR
jgi:hypothetical protein